MSKASIPSNIKVISGDYQDIYLDQYNDQHTHWSFVYNTQTKPTDKYTFRQVSILPCTVLDGKNKSSVKSNLDYYSRSRKWNDKTNQYDIVNVTSKVDDRQNLPMSGLQLLTTENRTNNLWFKVLTPERYVWDLSSTALFDISINAGISKDGVLNCDMIWASYHKRLRLIRVDSEIYKRIMMGLEV